MKKFIKFLIFIILILIATFGYSKIGEKNKELEINVGENSIEYHVVEDSYDNIHNKDNLFAFAFDINTKYSILEVDIGDKVYLDFGATPPYEFYIKDYLLTSEGKQQYNEKLTNDVPLIGDNDRYYLVVDIHMASYLSSLYEENKKDNRGFAIVTTTEGVEKTYLFVIRTKR